MRTSWQAAGSGYSLSFSLSAIKAKLNRLHLFFSKLFHINKICLIPKSLYLFCKPINLNFLKFVELLKQRACLKSCSFDGRPLSSAGKFAPPGDQLLSPCRYGHQNCAGTVTRTDNQLVLRNWPPSTGTAIQTAFLLVH